MRRSPWDIADTVNNRVIRCAMEMAWDTDIRRLAHVQEHLSVESADDRDFFAGLK